MFRLNNLPVRTSLSMLIAGLLCALFLVPASAQTAEAIQPISPTAASATTSLRLPADLYVLTNDGVVERYDLAGGGAQAVTPPDRYVIDFGIDESGERIAYRTEDGLLLGLTNGVVNDPIPVEGERAGVPAYRGRGSSVAWSPDGRIIAYTVQVGARAYLESSGGFADLQDGIFQNLSWSPLGTYLAAEADQNTWWVYRQSADGLALTSIIPSSIGTAWVSDSEIVFAPETGGLKLMNLAAANAQTTLLSEDLEYRLPFLTYDDRLVFFTRDPRDADTPEGYGQLRSLARGAATVETLGEPIPLAGMTWTPGGTLLLALQGGVLGLIDPATGEGVPFSVNNAVAYAWGPLALQPPPLVAPPTALPEVTAETGLPSIQATVTALALDFVTQTPGAGSPANPPTAGIPTGVAPALQPTMTVRSIQRATDTPEPAGVPTSEIAPGVQLVPTLSLSAPLFYLNNDAEAAAATGGVAQIWLLPGDGRPPFRFTGAIAPISEFAASPNGRAVAYVSDGALWVQQLEIRQPFVVATIPGFVPITPAFSPDGTRIAYALTGEDGAGIWVASLDGTPPQPVLTPEQGDSPLSVASPRWSPDGRRVLVDVFSAEQSGIQNAIVDVTNGQVTEIPSVGGESDTSAATTIWRGADRLLTIVAGGEALVSGLYTVNADGRTGAPAEVFMLPAATRVLALRLLDGSNSGAAAPGGVQARIAVTGGGGEVQILDLIGVDAVPVFSTDALRLSAVQFSPDGRFLVGIAPEPGAGALVGALVVIDLTQGGIFTLEAAQQAGGVQWAE